MVVRTTLQPDEIDRPLPDLTLAALLAQVRRRTGRNWQIVTRSIVRRRWYGRRETRLFYELFVEICGTPQWQCVSLLRPGGANAGEATHDAVQVEAFLRGLLRDLDAAGSPRVAHQQLLSLEKKAA